MGSGALHCDQISIISHIQRDNADSNINTLLFKPNPNHFLFEDSTLYTYESCDNSIFSSLPAALLRQPRNFFSILLCISSAKLLLYIVCIQ